MRQGQFKNRSRNRGNRRPSSPLSRVYESNGPDVKVRGTAQHVAEKYLQLARDAQASSDIIMSESYFQHAEHYLRIVAAAQSYHQQQHGGQAQPYQPRRQDGDEEGYDEGDDGLGDEQPQVYAEQPRPAEAEVERRSAPPPPAPMPAPSESRSEANEGRRSEASEGRRSDANEGRRSDAGEGRRSEASEGRRSEAGEGKRSEASEGRRSEAGEGKRNWDGHQPDFLRRAAAPAAPSQNGAASRPRRSRSRSSQAASAEAPAAAPEGESQSAEREAPESVS